MSVCISPRNSSHIVLVSFSYKVPISSANFNKLPPEIIRHILDQIPTTDLAKIPQVSKMFEEIRMDVLNRRIGYRLAKLSREKLSVRDDMVGGLLPKILEECRISKRTEPIKVIAYPKMITPESFTESSTFQFTDTFERVFFSILAIDSKGSKYVITLYQRYGKPDENEWMFYTTSKSFGKDATVNQNFLRKISQIFLESSS